MSKVNKKKWVLVLGGLILSVTLSFAKTASLDLKIQAAIEQYLADHGKQEGASGMALVISYPANHKILVKSFFAGKTSHQADARRINASNLFEIGSITKSYTAALMLQLQAEGVLSINDPLGKWLLQYPQWKEVTLKQLLNMTSGIPSYSSNPEFVKFLQNNFSGEFNDAYLLSFARPLEAVEPGKKFDYSNSNYVLAGLAIEAATGKSFAELLKTHIFDPLKLKNTFYAAGPNWKEVNQKTFPAKVHGYLYDNDSDKLLDLYNTNLSWAGPSGAIVSTPADQMKWVKALYHGSIFPKTARAELLGHLKSLVSIKTGQAIKTVNKEEPAGFGSGVASLYENNQPFWFYLGSTTAYRMLYIWQPCNDVAVLLAVNGKSADPKVQGETVLRQLLLKIYKLILAREPGLACSV